MKHPALCTAPSFAVRLLEWQQRHGRHDLPWQRLSDPYPVWLAEIMLQQTQVATVLPYYARFLARLPTLASLAAADLSTVLGLWSGLGYYARARNLWRSAQIVIGEYGGEFPRTAAAMMKLPGIGRSSANSIAAACFGERAPILDGNVKRVLCRVFGIQGAPGTATVDQRLWQLATDLLPQTEIRRYHQAQMDLGALLCSRAQPCCAVCPLTDLCVAQRTNRIAKLPTPRPRNLLERRTVRVLLLRAQNAVLLEQRPPQGIWGGLKSLPEAPEDVGTAEFVSQLGCNLTSDLCPLPWIEHRFTHFHLTLRPFAAEAKPLPQARNTRYVWLPIDEIAAAPLPAPVRKLLQAG